MIIQSKSSNPVHPESRVLQKSMGILFFLIRYLSDPPKRGFPRICHGPWFHHPISFFPTSLFVSCCMFSVIDYLWIWVLENRWDFLSPYFNRQLVLHSVIEFPPLRYFVWYLFSDICLVCVFKTKKQIVSLFLGKTFLFWKFFFVSQQLSSTLLCLTWQVLISSSIEDVWSSVEQMAQSTIQFPPTLCAVLST